MRCARPIILIVGVADRKFAVERVVDAEQPGPHVDLVVVVRVPAEPILPQRVAVQRRNVGNRKRRQRTPQRVVRRNDVGLPRNGLPRCGIESIAVANRYPIHYSRRGRIKNLSLKDRPPQRVKDRRSIRIHRLFAVQKLTEVALPLQRRWQRVHKAGVDRAVIIETIHVEKPECFTPLGNLGHRPPQGCPPVILGERELLVFH